MSDSKDLDEALRLASIGGVNEYWGRKDPFEDLRTFLAPRLAAPSAEGIAESCNVCSALIVPRNATHYDPQDLAAAQIRAKLICAGLNVEGKERAAPVAWRWMPSAVWGEYVFTEDPARAESAREHGMQVEALYTAPMQAAQDAPPVKESLTTDALAEAVLLAAVSCSHVINHERVELYFDPTTPGKNALNQLHRRIADALASRPADSTVMRDALRMVLDDMDVCCGEHGADYTFRELSEETVAALRALAASTKDKL